VTKQIKKNDNDVKRGLPSLDVRFNALVDSLRDGLQVKQENIPNASMVYGIAAAILFAIALYYFFTGLWFTGLLVLILAVALFGYALFFIRSTGA
jgi:tetrahydromethanopterin S-methyltransferase subunit B